ncbi:MAG: hypothetical protein QOH41_1497 [Blastocatellia bacterium]|jgi:hypothetical protein|nr:hypothetical protein [Blastocatellia bacterium]
MCMLIYATKVWDKEFLLTERAIHNLLLLIMCGSCYRMAMIGLSRPLFVFTNESAYHIQYGSQPYLGKEVHALRRNFPSVTRELIRGVSSIR